MKYLNEFSEYKKYLEIMVQVITNIEAFLILEFQKNFRQILYYFDPILLHSHIQVKMNRFRSLEPILKTLE